MKFAVCSSGSKGGRPSLCLVHHFLGKRGYEKCRCWDVGGSVVVLGDAVLFKALTDSISLFSSRRCK